ncbi:hypothetical protein A1Q2_02268 [Trichosporon asahii var. asahii CBS 8904]|uniref:Uncharacterized protein n=1 Tax=Trichosporon asahii var. asahii (strain CBS 8904) TaxID=1220162 RepID=K1VS81_TRIAC|nr:hypothetical protein A1Q2_02268 [Trichosporon asahii var. asahii CBS 8904]
MHPSAYAPTAASPCPRARELESSATISELMTSTPPWAEVWSSPSPPSPPSPPSGPAITLYGGASYYLPDSEIRMTYDLPPSPLSPSQSIVPATIPRAMRPSTVDAANRPGPQVPIPSMLTPGTRDAHSTLTLSLAIARRISWHKKHVEECGAGVLTDALSPLLRAHSHRSTEAGSPLTPAPLTD